jgi:hypothetical protein
MVDDHEPGECLLGSPTPGDDRRALLKRNAPAKATGARDDPSNQDDQARGQEADNYGHRVPRH